MSKSDADSFDIIQDVGNHKRFFTRKLFRSHKFADLVLSHIDFIDSIFECCAFNHCSFTKVKFDDCNFEANFETLKMDSNFYDCSFVRTCFTCTNVTSYFYSCSFHNACFKNKEGKGKSINKITKATFHQCYFKETKFESTIIERTKFLKCEFSDVDFTSCKLEDVDFSDSELKDCSFTVEQLSQKDLKWPRGFKKRMSAIPPEPKPTSA